MRSPSPHSPLLDPVADMLGDSSTDADMLMLPVAVDDCVAVAVRVDVEVDEPEIVELIVAVPVMLEEALDVPVAVTV